MKEILREGKLFLGGSFLMAIGFLAIYLITCSPVFLILACVFVFIFAYTIFFLRIPCRTTQKDPNCIYASADGNIFAIEENVKAPVYLDGPANKVLIFMNIASVHWNYAPIEGKIEFEQYNKGSFKNVFRESAWNVNEHQLIGLHDEKNNIKVLVSMIAGLVARRIRFFRKTGDRLNQGERFGLIKYGSANMLFFPPEFKICVKKGQKTRAGITVIARKQS